MSRHCEVPRSTPYGVLSSLFLFWGQKLLGYLCISSFRYFGCLPVNQKKSTSQWFETIGGGDTSLYGTQGCVAVFDWVDCHHAGICKNGTRYFSGRRKQLILKRVEQSNMTEQKHPLIEPCMYLRVLVASVSSPWHRSLSLPKFVGDMPFVSSLLCSIH